MEPLLGVVKPKETPVRSDVLFEAERLINGDRNQSYGKPTQNFENIAEFWTTRLKHKLGNEIVTAVDVADLLILLKVARSIASHTRDNYVDIAGYAGCGWECAEETFTAPIEPF